MLRIEARQEIGQIPIRYAIAVDSRDMEAWANLFVLDVSAGRRGRDEQPCARTSARWSPGSTARST
ncbi:hypothetical protein [Streptomyces sp. KL116D]|uniref:hypothetical protein n=1 Tax=Streptomyces sp. KL116D TaxID=3045152 RepID=UPI0035565CDE